jgi:hypothetical protein
MIAVSTQSERRHFARQEPILRAFVRVIECWLTRLPKAMFKHDEGAQLNDTSGQPIDGPKGTTEASSAAKA